MRKPLVAMSMGMLLLVSCNNAQSTLPRLSDNSQAGQAQAMVSQDSMKHYAVLYAFSGFADGSAPFAPMARDSAGNLYGTTIGGGTNFGVVFRVDPNGTEIALHTFNDADGNYPVAPVIIDASGNLYGTTVLGGYKDNGVVFKLDPSGNETLLHRFKGVDGANPREGLVRDNVGNLYGTTVHGGSGDGVVFKVGPGGKEIVLHAFSGMDGNYPTGTLVRDGAGNLYGTTYVGGASGNGVVFRLDRAGIETVLYSFSGSDGANPLGVIRDKAGNLYGTTQNGGSSGLGVVFKLDPTNTETVLHSFAFVNGTGNGDPNGGLARDSAGDLFGTTMSGAINGSGQGSAFELDPNDNQTILHIFYGKTGEDPHAGLIRDADGNLYGTTCCGGPGGSGVVFELSPK